MDKVKAIRINTSKLWQRLKEYSENIQIDTEGLSISKEWHYELKDEIPIRLENMIDLAMDECQNLYIVDGNQKGIYKYDTFFLTITEVFSCDDSLPLVPEFPVGISIDKDTLYIADSQEFSIPKIIAYSRKNLQLKWVRYLSDFNSIRDITTGNDGRIYVLTEKAVLVLNRGGERLNTLIPSGLYDMEDPSDMTVSIDGKVYVLDRELMKKNNKLYLIIHTFEPTENYQLIRVFTNFKIEDKIIPSGLSIGRDGSMYVGVKKSPEEFITIYKFDLRKTPVLVPIWIYRDTTRRLINDSRDNIYIINGSGNKLFFLEYKEFIKKDSKGSFTATYTSKVIDSHQTDNTWHRFNIEGRFPEGTRVKFYYYISDNKDDFPPDEKWINAISSDASAQGRNKREGLFISSNKGQYLWFRIILSGTAEKTPVVNSLSLFFPRYAYLDMLPALYREDQASSEFLERFLSVFESLLYETDYSISHMSRYMDILGAPEEFLDWLGKWLSMEFSNILTEKQKRSLLLKAPELYKMRGTRKGIEEIVEILTGKKPFIVENICLKDSSVNVQLEKEEIAWCKEHDNTIFAPSLKKSKTCEGEEVNLFEKLYGTDPFSFCILLTEKLPSSYMLALKEILEDFKPAHTKANIRSLESWFYLDGHTYLGLNTVLNKENFILEKSVLGRDTILTDLEDCAQISRKSRIGIDFKIT